ncbi:hypothetical protein GZD23_003972, partial [Salmonella enterica subsp. enterica]|nr:hypothetical protein [Salmonella enterica subsp. enterica serovar Nima]
MSVDERSAGAQAAFCGTPMAVPFTATAIVLLRMAVLNDAGVGARVPVMTGLPAASVPCCQVVFSTTPVAVGVTVSWSFTAA